MILLQTGFLHHVLGDAHIYMNHVDALKEQVSTCTEHIPFIEYCVQGFNRMLHQFAAYHVHTLLILDKLGSTLLAFRS